MRTKSLKSICHKGNTVMYFIVTKNHLQMSCYRKQENSAKDAKPKTEINNIAFTGSG